MISKEHKLTFLLINNYLEIKQKNKVIYTLYQQKNYFKFNELIRLIERNKQDKILKIINRTI